MIQKLIYTSCLSVVLAASAAQASNQPEGNEGQRRVPAAVPADDQANVGNWNAVYTLKDGRSTIQHTPNRIIIGGMSAGSLNLDSRSYNGMAMNQPLVVRPNMSQADFEAALRASGLMN